MIRTYKFSAPLPSMILRGLKYCTFRVDDEADVKPGDTIHLCHENGEVFGESTVISVKYTTFGQLTEEDFEGHERYLSNSDMYDMYSMYYKKEITPNTNLKIVKFRRL